MVLFVAKFDEVTDEEDLRVLFSRYGTVANVDMFRDRKTKNHSSMHLSKSQMTGTLNVRSGISTGDFGMEEDSKSAKGVRAIVMIDAKEIQLHDRLDGFG